jgi:predicted nucleic acid-binding protein
MILLDANVILDIWDMDPTWNAWSSGQLRRLSMLHELAIDSIVYAEISTRFATLAALDSRVEELGLEVLNIPRDAAFLAGKAFVEYRRRGGQKRNVLADFFIGAHATVLRCPLVTRDTRRYRAFFPTVRLIAP